MATVKLLSEAMASLESTVFKLFEPGLGPTSVFMQATEDISVRLGRMTQLHRTLLQTELSFTEPAAFSCPPALTRFGISTSELTSGLIEYYDRLSDWLPTPENKNCDPPGVPQPESAMISEDTSDNDDASSAEAAHEQLSKSQQTTYTRTRIWHRCAASLRNLYPYLRPDGKLQLLRGEVLTPDLWITRPDGTTRLAKISTLHAIRDSPNSLGFKLPPLHDPIYLLYTFGLDDPAYLDGVKCQICFDELSRADFSFLGCRCIYCNKCLNSALRAGFTTRALYPPRCLCRGIDLTNLGPVLDKDVLDLSIHVPEEWKTRSPTYCSGKACGNFISRVQFFSSAGMKLQYGTCPQCGEMTCSKCKQAEVSHRDLCGKCPRRQIPPELYAFIKQEKLSRCPDCKALVELLEGCNDVSCVCGASFCYGCGKGYEGDEGCNCPNPEPEHHEWSEGARGVEAQLSVDDWPLHEKILGTDCNEARSGCLHMRAMAATGQSRCHGCLQIVGYLKRCFECHVELCKICRPQMPNYDVEI